MKQKNQIKAIVFDIGGVMASENNLKEHYGPLCKALRIDKKKFFEVRDKYTGLAASGKISGKKMVSLFSQDLKIGYQKLLRNWIKYKRKSMKKNLELENFIENLKKADYIVASLSNVLDIHYKVGMEKKIYSPFHFNIMSFDVGFSKPDVRIYRLLLKRLKVPAKNVVFIDDYQICLDGAKKLGINTILFKNNKQLVKALTRLGVKV